MTNHAKTYVKLMQFMAVGGLLVAGCASAPSAPGKLSSAELSIISYGGLSGSAKVEVNNAVEELTQQCMQSQGLVEYPDLLTAADAASSGPSLAGLPQAYIGLAQREANGYGFYAQAVDDAANQANGQSGQFDQEEAYIDSLPASSVKSYELALDGPIGTRATITLPGGGKTSIPSGGCLGKAEQKVYGSVSNYLLAEDGADILRNTLMNAVTADPAFKSATSTWSSCMKKAGYSYATPQALWNALADKIFKAPSLALKELEIKTSVADYNCATSSKLVPAVKALQTRHATELSGTLLQQLASISQIETTAENNAKALHLSE